MKVKPIGCQQPRSAGVCGRVKQTIPSAAHHNKHETTEHGRLVTPDGTSFGPTTSQEVLKKQI